MLHLVICWQTLRFSLCFSSSFFLSFFCLFYHILIKPILVHLVGWDPFFATRWRQINETRDRKPTFILLVTDYQHIPDFTTSFSPKASFESSFHLDYTNTRGVNCLRKLYIDWVLVVSWSCKRIVIVIMITVTLPQNKSK